MKKFCALITAAIAVLAVPSAASASPTGPGDCAAPALTQPFLAWNDTNAHVGAGLLRVELGARTIDHAAQFQRVVQAEGDVRGVIDGREVDLHDCAECLSRRVNRCVDGVFLNVDARIRSPFDPDAAIPWLTRMASGAV